MSGVAELLHKLITDPLAETSFTIAVMYGSYVLAESLGVSGLIAVPIAVLYMGNRTMRTAMSEETRETMIKFWEMVTFLATAFAFLLIGLKADFKLLIAYAPFIIVAFAAIIISRILSVYPILWFAQLMGEKIPASWKRILAFAGLRGAVSIALVLSPRKQLQRHNTSDGIRRGTPFIDRPSRNPASVCEKGISRRRLP